jgi:hypothetical protein
MMISLRATMPVSHSALVIVYDSFENSMYWNVSGDCKLIWSSRWTVCSKKCDSGTQSRKMRIIRHSKPGGKACPLVMPTQSRPCNEVACSKSTSAPTLAPLFKPRKPTTQIESQKQPISVLLCRTTKGHFRMISRRSRTLFLVLFHSNCVDKS